MPWREKNRQETGWQGWDLSDCMNSGAIKGKLDLRIRKCLRS